MRLSSSEWGGALSTFGETYDGNGDPLVQTFGYQMPGLTMDDAKKLFSLAQPEFIKIDVDGIEALILAGGERVLAGARSVLIEINDDLEIAQNALKAYYTDDLRDRAIDRLMSNAPFGSMPSEEQIQDMMKLLKGNAMGGSPIDRRNFQEGTPDPTLPQPKPKGPMDDRKVENLMRAAPALENPGQVKEMAMKDEDVFAALRRRLPQEITDDVVRLIAYNPEAFADFADISDQSDVDSFNEKYNVQLVLPVENVT